MELEIPKAIISTDFLRHASTYGAGGITVTDEPRVRRRHSFTSSPALKRALRSKREICRIGSLASCGFRAQGLRASGI